MKAQTTVFEIDLAARAGLVALVACAGPVFADGFAFVPGSFSRAQWDWNLISGTFTVETRPDNVGLPTGGACLLYQLPTSTPMTCQEHTDCKRIVPPFPSWTASGVATGSILSDIGYCHPAEKECWRKDDEATCIKSSIPLVPNVQYQTPLVKLTGAPIWWRILTCQNIANPGPNGVIMMNGCSLPEGALENIHYRYESGYIGSFEGPWP